MAATRLESNVLNVAHWNANGLRQSLSELKDFLRLHQIDIMLINESKLNSKVNIYVPGYNKIRKDRGNGKTGGGVLILIKMSIRYTELNVNTKNIETVAIKLTNNIIIVSAYNAPQNKLSTEDLELIFKLGPKVLLYGDLNAKNMAWRCYRGNLNGKIFLEFANKKLLKILTPDNFTLYPYTNAQPSIVDIGLAKNINCYTDVTVIDELSSDHNPIKIILDFDAEYEVREKQYINYKKADWIRFRNIINKELVINSSFKDRTEIDTGVDLLLDTIDKAKSMGIPIVKCTDRHKPLPLYIKKMIKTRNSLRRIFQRTNSSEVRKIKNKLANKIDREIKKFENLNWDQKLQNLKVKDNSLWKMTKCLIKNKNEIPTLHGLNGLVTTDEEKAAVLAYHYEKVHHLTEDMGDDYGTERMVNNRYIKIQNTVVNEEDIDLVSPREIKIAITRTGSRKAPGLDGIQNIILKNLPKKAFVQLTYIFNACLKLSYFPDSWKTANVLPFHKPGKDKNFPVSYRPISLLPTLGKLLEKIIYNRIKNLEEKINILIPEQFGFRPKRNTVSQLIRVTNFISSNFNKNMSTAMLLLDLEKAFDTVWHKGLIYKLDNNNFPVYLTKIIQNYLMNRKFVVTVNGVKSEKQNIKAGVPQGSILGPVLFIYYINDVPRHSGIILSLFADDTAAMAASMSKRLAIQRLQTYALALEEYLEKWKLKLNVDKTELIIFTHKSKKEKIPDFVMQGKIIEIKLKVKYLGLMLHHKLNFNAHIDLIKANVMKMLGMLYCLIGRRSIMNIKNKMIIYNVIVKALMLYAAPVWSNTTASNILKLQRVQNRIVRMMINAKPRDKNVDIHQRLNLKYVEEEIYARTKNYFENQIMLVPDMQEARVLTVEEMPFRMKYNMPYHILIK